MNRLNKNFLTKLYNKGFSIQEIADKLKINYHTLKYYFGKYKIPRRSWSEATYVKRNPNGDPFTKTIVKPSRGKGTYKKKCKYGVLTASCHNTKLKKALDEMLRKYWSKSAFGLEGL